MLKGEDRRGTLAAIFAVPLGLAAASAATAKPAVGNSVNGRLDLLESKDQIAELLYAYARSNDRADEALMRSVFWPESTHKHGRFEGKSSDFVGFAFKIVSALKYACHHITNVSIKVDGNRAFSECYYFAQHRRVRADGKGEEDQFFQGRYLDDHERRDGTWKIIRRRGLSDYTSPPIPAETLYAAWPAGQHSLKYPEDEYYRMQQEFRAAR